jgi:hypothetical protein
MNEDYTPEELNLSDEENNSNSELEKYETKPYDPEPERENVRSRLAFTLVGILGTVIIVPLLAIVLGYICFADIKGFMDSVLSPTFGIAGAVIGFYFGAKTSKG